MKKKLDIFYKLLYDIVVMETIPKNGHRKGQSMKKITAISLLIVMILAIFAIIYKVEATNNTILSNETEGKLVQLKQDELKSLADYRQKYGSDAYGTVAYILNLVRIYSIPFCFLGIAVGAIHKYVIGIRKLDTLEKGLGLIVTFVTLLIICQILPLAFAVFVKFGRG